MHYGNCGHYFVSLIANLLIDTKQASEADGNIVRPEQNDSNVLTL